MLGPLLDTLYCGDRRQRDIQCHRPHIRGGACAARSALAAITVCFSPALFLLALAMTIGQGSATLVSIKLGEGDRRGAERVLGQAVFMFFAFYAITATLVLCNMDSVLRFFGATERILPDAKAYYSIIIGGLIFEKISFGVNNLIRAEGRPTYSMATIIIGGVANVILVGCSCANSAGGYAGRRWRQSRRRHAERSGFARSISAGGAI